MDRLIQTMIYAFVAIWSRARLSAVWTSSIDSRLGLRDGHDAPRLRTARPKRPGRCAMTIRVLVATAVRPYRDGLQRILQGAEGIALAGIAATAEQIVEQACKLLPSVILLDVDMARSLALQKQLGGTPRFCGVVILGRPELYSDVVACLPAEVLAFVHRDATVAGSACGDSRRRRSRARRLAADAAGAVDAAQPGAAPASIRDRAPHRARDGDPAAHAAGPA